MKNNNAKINPAIAGLAELNSYLFDALNEVTNPDLKGDSLNEAFGRASAVTRIADTVIRNTSTMMGVVKMQVEYGNDRVENLMLGESKEK